MGSTLSIIEFFYNAIPGIYFIHFANIMEKTSLQQNDQLYSLLFGTLGILVGFLFQSFTKIVRRMGIDTYIIGQVIKNNCKLGLFEKAINILKMKVIKKEKDDHLYSSNIQIFYLMDNYLNTHDANKLPTYYSPRVSLWANLAWANFALSIYHIYTMTLYPTTYTLIINIFCIWSFVIFLDHLTAYWDVVLKSFITCDYNFQVFKKNKN